MQDTSRQERWNHGLDREPKILKKYVNLDEQIQDALCIQRRTLNTCMCLVGCGLHRALCYWDYRENLNRLGPRVIGIAGQEGTDREKDANRELALQPARVTQSCLWQSETAALFRAGSDLPSLSYLCWHFWSSQLLNTKTGSMQPSYSAQQLSGVLTESCLPLRPKIPPSPLCSKSRGHLWCILWWEGEQTLQSHFSNVT